MRIYYSLQTKFGYNNNVSRLNNDYSYLCRIHSSSIIPHISVFKNNFILNKNKTILYTK